MPLLRALVLLMLAGWGSAAIAQDPPNWNRPTAPFRIIGNLYYVGTEGLSSFLLTGPRGHVLIDGATEPAGPMIEANIRTLGFRLRDVKYLLINHAHFDHSAGLAELKRATGAKLIAGAGDRASLETGRTQERDDLDPFPAVKVDGVAREGVPVRVGPIVLTPLATSGHTPGATSWLTTVAGKRVIFASSITVAGLKLEGNARYPQAVADFRRTFAKLRATKADIFVNFHSEGFDLERKRKALAAGQADAFVDPGELARRVNEAEQAFDVELAKQRATTK